MTVAAPVAPVRALLTGIVDYAGLYPPASLLLGEATRTYDAELHGAASWMLGRFVIGAERLDELDAALNRMPPREAPGERPWRVSALVRPASDVDRARVSRFNARAPARLPTQRDAAVDVVEVRATPPDALAAALEQLPPGLVTYVEVPVDGDPMAPLERIAAAGARAKVRTGGVTADAFPTVEQLARFLRRCAELGLPFKATAGLHHPVRGEHPLTYAADSPRGRMHGFVNLFLAAAAVRAGSTETDLVALLGEEDGARFRFEEGGVSWRHLHLGTALLNATRREAAMAFGSCSFREPLRDLGHMQLV